MRNALSRLHRASSPAALLISLLALIVATSAGSAYAATKIGTSQIEKAAITTPKIKKNAVTSAKIKDGTIQTRDLAPAAVTQFTTKPTPPTPAAFPGKIYTALVNGVGTTATGVGVTGVTNVATGLYLLTFAPDLSGCSIQATVNEDLANPLTIASKFHSPHEVKVIVNIRMAGTWQFSNRPFSVTLFCPAN